MASIHLILLNLIYDISCTAIPWDNVDKEFLTKPRKWDASSVSKFMLWIGPTSSVFDILTYALMYFIICPAVVGGHLFHELSDPAQQALYIAVFQAGWFVESIVDADAGYPYDQNAKDSLPAEPRFSACDITYIYWYRSADSDTVYSGGTCYRAGFAAW
mgnify:CR=1 FL=1